MEVLETDETLSVVGVECFPSYHRVFSPARQQLPSNPVTKVYFKRRLIFLGVDRKPM